jgi:hypothetical protein
VLVGAREEAAGGAAQGWIRALKGIGTPHGNPICCQAPARSSLERDPILTGVDPVTVGGSCRRWESHPAPHPLHRLVGGAGRQVERPPNRHLAMALPQGHGCPRPRWHQYLENCPVSARKFATISSDRVGLVSWMAARNSCVLARCLIPSKCSRSKARCAAFRAANSMSAGVNSSEAPTSTSRSMSSSVPAHPAGPPVGHSRSALGEETPGRVDLPSSWHTPAGGAGHPAIWGSASRTHW